jgi:hypothetical protein
MLVKGLPRMLEGTGLEGEVEGGLELSYSDNRDSQRLPHRGIASHPPQWQNVISDHNLLSKR